MGVEIQRIYQRIAVELQTSHGIDSFSITQLEPIVAQKLVLFAEKME